MEKNVVFKNDYSGRDQRVLDEIRGYLINYAQQTPHIVPKHARLQICDM
jgi:hypothetical protein